MFFHQYDISTQVEKKSRKFSKCQIFPDIVVFRANVDKTTKTFDVVFMDRLTNTQTDNSVSLLSGPRGAESKKSPAP